MIWFSYQAGTATFPFLDTKKVARTLLLLRIRRLTCLGYSGVGIYTRQAVCAPIRAEEGLLGVLCPPNSDDAYTQMPSDLHIGGYLSPSQIADLQVNAAELDAEGRCVILEFPAFVLFGIYSPANSSGLRDDFRHGFQIALDTRIRNLVKLGKRVVVCGDLNVSREEIDTANAEDMKKKEGVSHQDYVSTPNRRLFNQLLEGGVVFGERDEGREHAVMWDVCRGFHPDRTGMFTHWEQKINARPGNFGSRIDFILCSLDMKSWFCQSDIQEGLMGSDHCPVFAVLKAEVATESGRAPLKDMMNPSGVFQNGHRMQDYSTSHAPAFSARLMPEFARRRNIKDMFGTKSSIARLSSLTGVDHTSASDNNNAALPTPSSSDFDPTVLSKAAKSPDHHQSAQDRKRPAPSSSPVKSGKVLKSSTASKGQQSLRGFFKPKSSDAGPKSASSPKSAPQRDEDANEGLESVQSSAAEFAGPLRVSQDDPTLSKIREAEEVPIVDPDESKLNWSKLFTKPTAPRCEHGEACKVMKTKKAGFNCGREFWMCQR